MDLLLIGWNNNDVLSASDTCLFDICYSINEKVLTINNIPGSFCYLDFLKNRGENKNYEILLSQIDDIHEIKS